MTWTNPYAPYQSGTYTSPFGGANFSQYSGGNQTLPYSPLQQSNGNMLTVFIDSEQEVNDYPVAAGTTVQLISFKLGKFWLKSTATNGVPQPIRIFSFSEETPKIQNEPNSVTRQEFDDLNRKLDKLLKELGGEG